MPILQMKKLRTQVTGPKTHSWEATQVETQSKLTGFRVVSHKHKALLPMRTNPKEKSGHLCNTFEELLPQEAMSLLF